MLEGQPVYPPAPKSHFSKDLEFNADTHFCGSKHDFVYVKGGAIAKGKLKWWQRDGLYSFQFRRQIAQNDQIDVAPCARCFWIDKYNDCSVLNEAYLTKDRLACSSCSLVNEWMNS